MTYPATTALTAPAAADPSLLPRVLRAMDQLEGRRKHTGQQISERLKQLGAIKQRLIAHSLEPEELLQTPVDLSPDARKLIDDPEHGL